MICFLTVQDNCIWVFGDVASDDAVKGSLAGDQLDIQYMINSMWCHQIRIAKYLDALL